MRTIAIINQKGGVGKTTTTVNVGAGLARAGRKVLVMDLDPQAHLTYSLGIAGHDLPATTYEVLAGRASVADILAPAAGLDVAPASLRLSGAEVELAATPGREHLLREALEGVTGYDFILLDCPPNLGLLTVNALTAAREVFIPLQAEFLALHSMGKLLETIRLVQKRLNPALEISGIIGTRFTMRKKLNREVVKKIEQYFGDKLFSTFIRDNIALAEAPSFGQDIFSYRPRSNGARDYAALCREILKRG